MGAKYENGAKLQLPVAEIVETKAMGLGVIPPIISLYI